ncbi:MAG TPA: prepilin-type N-terminal cleavage/methylation domain-containing protein, partial [Phycisphaerae bacterium]|nr:prepilin-type N-terminal cleavage/methylation domain-containing protein [Phycisphaerae bacterium]
MRTQNVNKKGFTLAEVLIASLIAGLCLAGAMTAISSNVQLTIQSEEMSQAVFLAQEIREWSLNISFASISTMAMSSVSPKDSEGETLAGYNGWTETITVTYVN